MSTGSTSPRTAHASSAPPADVTLENWPLRDDGPSAWVAQSLLLALAGLAGACGGSWAMALILWGALQLALWRMWLPAEFLIDHRGLHQTVLGHTRFFPWNRLSRVEVQRAGLLVLFDGEELPLAAYRSLFLRYRHQREPLLALFEFYVPARVSRVA